MHQISTFPQFYMKKIKVIKIVQKSSVSSAIIKKASASPKTILKRYSDNAN
jgi:hypothetical protein